jgi:hypothetical protein
MSADFSNESLDLIVEALPERRADLGNSGFKNNRGRSGATTDQGSTRKSVG